MNPRAPLPAPSPLPFDRPPAPPVELSARECRYTVAEDADYGDRYLFCAGPAVEGRPYCLAHCGIAYVPLGQRTPKQQRPTLSRPVDLPGLLKRQQQWETA